MKDFKLFQKVFTKYLKSILRKRLNIVLWQMMQTSYKNQCVTVFKVISPFFLKKLVLSSWLKENLSDLIPNEKQEYFFRKNNIQLQAVIFFLSNQATSILNPYVQLTRGYIYHSLMNCSFRWVLHNGLNGILLLKLFWPTVRKNCSSNREKILKFKAEGQEFAKFLRSLEQFIQTVKS